MASARLIASSIVAFCAYAAWAYYANSLVTDDLEVLLKAALVQGSYSATITLVFTMILEFFHAKYGHAGICIAFLIPSWSKADSLKTHETDTVVDEAMVEVKKILNIQKTKPGSYIPGMLLVPIPALLVQTGLVFAVNVFFDTPNLWLTIAPSIIFSAVYGFGYSIALTKRQQRLNVTNS